MATDVQWIVTLAYPIGMLVLEQILIAGVKLGPKITLDVIEEMQATLRKEFDDKLNALKEDLLKKIAEL